jgi:hypothetical protein
MLPKHVVNLHLGFVQAFDSEHPPVLEFRKAHNPVVWSSAQRGVIFGSGEVSTIGENLRAFLMEKAGFVWMKLKEVVILTEIEPSPDLSSDLKSQVATHYVPTQKAATQFIEELRQQYNVPRGYTLQTVASFATILIKINAEIDLFCAAYAVQKSQKSPTGGPSFNNFTGVYGNVTNSHITLYDFGTICQVLKDHGVSRNIRNELEDIMDALKHAEPEKREVLLSRAEQWIVKHQELLGKGAEAVTKAVRAAIGYSNNH